MQPNDSNLLTTQEVSLLTSCQAFAIQPPLQRLMRTDTVSSTQERFAVLILAALYLASFWLTIGLFV